MGIYEYECPNGHITERFESLSKRLDVIECAHCNEQAKFVLSATPTSFRQNDRKAFKRQGH